MAASALNVLSGIAAAAAGLAGDKVSKDGDIPGLDLASIVPALLGKKAGGAAGLVGSIASFASKAGLLKNANLGNLAELAGSLFSVDKTAAPGEKPESGTVAGLAAAIMGSSGKGTALSKIATMASGLASTAKNKKEVTGIAGELGKTLSSFGLSFGGSKTAITALTKVTEDGTKGTLLKTILKNLV